MGENSKEFNLKFIKNNWNWILLAVILCFGFYLRIYHLDYPVVGYHNMKETHYLTEARNYAREGFFKYGFFVPSWDYPGIDTDPSGVHSDTFPTISIIVGLFFKIFGFKLWIARLINVLFVLSSIFFFYLIIKRLFEREDLALTSALLLSLNPLLVFFGRQVQLINPALFFCFMGIYFYLKWLDDFSWKNLILFSIPLFLGILTKYSFALFAIPLIAIFPFRKELLNKNRWKQYGAVIIIALLFSSWHLYSSRLSENISSQVSSINLGVIFTGTFWNIIKSFFSDNYTLLGLFFAFIGMLLFLFLTKNKNKTNTIFIKSYLIGSVIWFLVLADKLKGHNYHQYPIMPLIVFFIAYFFVVLASNISNLFKLNKLKWVIILVLFCILAIPSIKAKDRMFDVQFYGLDLAGYYLNNHKQPGERIMHSGHQAYGLLWHADMKGTSYIPDTLDKLKFAEGNLNASWIFIYNWDLNIINDEERWNYIQQNYGLKQIAFAQTKDGLKPIYLLLKKGGSFDINKLDEMLKDQPIYTKEYDLTKGKTKINYATFDS